ncbi:sodium-dependent transporter [Paenibacillus thiaminolyticus]|uniref:Sodium-dependent transporter n=1 Tax=Paenibacillus thiaminolyticus TaxID=49283 RepID=A0AAP9DSP8_PANTH|nr:sodium-dependent transporter [Paenibacillus thiaminolyticus]MCY9533466.1 sodium-dependent transporter [Paenibacillus thiaminolyticus]MCY9604131.1 sodium-dependent transporter [Paenibacillus thiaminolyticus]MCY9606321.1 sodium-dependent transporter [Paenibacillus thiaminolyticus]MCY9612071.1 sodium-dependent transporter [Paenibacillus thiaminolyticus]MCY9618092.1 sodium-dependent transporter [Paenibacillus thiaminolyticus]
MTTREQWTSKLGFILASAGSAIGLGAIWKFPNVVATSGGGAFFLIFLLFTLGIGLPLLLAEFAIGRSTGRGAVSAYQDIAPRSKWHWIGYLGIGTCFLLLSYYSVVGGWIVLYVGRGIVGGLLSSGQDYDALFAETVANPWYAVAAQFVFMLITIAVVARGIKGGIERASRIMMPGLFVLFLVLIIRSLTLPGMGEGLRYFLQPDFSKLTGQAVLYALGQSFFCLSVGVSVMVTYSSYLSRQESLLKSSVSVVGLNVLTSLMAGLAIFPAIFALGMKPQEGPGLLFGTLPALFEKLPFGGLFIVLFLALFLFAALTSAFSMLEILVSGLSNNDQQRSRLSWLFGILIFIVGIPSALSFGVWSDARIFGLSLFDAADFAVTNVLMPFGALLIALFVGYRFPRKRLYEEFATEAAWWRKGLALYIILLRYVIPVVIAIVFLHVLGLLKL